MGSGITENGKLVFPSQYLAAPDLQGRDVTIQIESTTVEMLMIEGGKKKKSLIINIKGKDKKFVANTTNQKTIKGLYGPEIMDWAGKKITLYPTKCSLAGKQVDCIRIREAVPA